MNEQLAILIQTQEIDTRLDVIAEQRRRFPSLLEEAAKPLQEAQEALAAVQVELDASTRQRREKELDLKDREERIEKLRSRSHELKSNREYQTHLVEIELAQQEKGTVEERILELMERGDGLQKKVRDHEAQVVIRRREHDAQRVRLTAEHDALEAEAKRLTDEHGVLAERLALSHRQSYEHLKATRKGLAVAPLKNGACQGCRLALPPQLIADIRKNEKILTCTYCHRILYSPPPAVEALKA